MKMVIQIILLIFNYIVLCCPLCTFKNMHEGHKVLEIDDEDSLKKENLTVQNYKKEIDINIQKLENLKELIEKEMNEIDNAYEKVDKETTKSYELKREKLNKEEYELKEKLKTEVTKVKEKFEIYLTEIYNLLKTCEKLSKGINSLEKEEKNMIKTLSYISKININKEKMRNIFQESMKNLKISFIEEENTIKYEEYYFNGIPIPSNIKFKEINTDSFKIMWKLDEVNILNVDKKEINYIVEIRKEKKQKKFSKIYEGKVNNLSIDKLEKNTTYEIRLCSVYKDITSNWTPIYKVKTIFDSKILCETERGEEFVNKLYEWTGYKQMELLYRGTRDGSGSNIFHNKCDNQGPTICLIKNDKGNIFGGYSSISWTSDNGKFKNANDCFLFTLTNIHETTPTKYPNANMNNSVFHHSKYGPTFGNGFDLHICDNYFNFNNSNSYLGNAYPDILKKGRSVFTGDTNNNNEKIIIKELEVFKLK